MSGHVLSRAPVHSRLRAYPLRYEPAAITTSSLLTPVLGPGILSCHRCSACEPLGLFRFEPAECPDQLFLKVVSRANLDREQATAEMAHYLAHHQVPIVTSILSTPRPIGNDYAFVAYPLIDGHFAVPTVSELDQLGQALALMHHVLRSIPRASAIQSASDARLQRLEQRRRQFRLTSLPGIPQHLKLSIDSMGSSWAKLPGMPQAVHGDLHHGNVLFDASGHLHLLDLEDAQHSYLPPTIDIAMVIERFVLALVESDDGVLQLAKAFLEGYQKVSKKPLFHQHGELARLLRWLSARAVLILAETGGAVTTIDEEWKKFDELAQLHVRRQDLLKAIERPFLLSR